MKGCMSVKKWLLTCFCTSLLLLAAVCVLVLATDPFCRFRFRDGTFLLGGRHVSPGLVKNYDYNAFLVGSSMTQNFDVDHFEALHDVDLLLVGLGGMGPEEESRYLHLAEQTGKAQSYFVCIDLATFGRELPIRTEEYLFDFGVASNLKYFMDYDAVVRAVPKRIAVDGMTMLGLPIPGSVQKYMDANKLGQWSDTVVFGEHVVLTNYFAGKFATNELDPQGLEERMKASIDHFFEGDIDWRKCMMFLPPYSVLYWYQMKQETVLDELLTARAYFVQKATMAGCTVFDFQVHACTMSLDNYKDTTHYAPAINNLIAELLLDPSYIVTPESVARSNQILLENVDIFQNQFSEFEQTYGALSAKRS